MKQKKIDIKKVNENRVTILICTFFFIDLLSQFIGRGTWQFVIEFIIIIIGLFIARETFLNEKDKKYLVFVMILLFFHLISSMHTDNKFFNGATATFMYGMAGFLLIKYKLNVKLVNFFFLLNIFLLTYALISGVSVGNSDIMSASRNAISVYLIIQMALIIINYKRNGKEIPLWQIVISTVLAIWANGRSGIISITILLIFLIFFKLYKAGLSVKKITYITIILGIAIIVLYHNFELIVLPTIERFASKGVEDEARQMVINKYFTEVNYNYLNALLGVKMNNIYIFEALNLNLHNSYLRLHEFYGLIVFFIVVFFIVRRVLRYVYTKNIVYLVLFLVILLRISTDTIAFPGILDPFIYYLVFNYDEKYLNYEVSNEAV